MSYFATYVYIMFPATTAATAVRNVARRVIWSVFCLETQVLLGIITISHGLSRYPLRFLTGYKGIRYKSGAEPPETRRRATYKHTVCHGRL